MENKNFNNLFTNICGYGYREGNKIVCLQKKLDKFMTKRGIKHIIGRAHHPQTQGEIERYYRTMKSMIKLDTYYFPEQLEGQITAFIDHYNNYMYHESLDNMTHADVYFGKSKEIKNKREQTKIRTLKKRRQDYMEKNFKKWFHEIIF